MVTLKQLTTYAGGEGHIVKHYGTATYIGTIDVDGISVQSVPCF